jgi:hypothetical protein
VLLRGLLSGRRNTLRREIAARPVSLLLALSHPFAIQAALLAPLRIPLLSVIIETIRFRIVLREARPWRKRLPKRVVFAYLRDRVRPSHRRFSACRHPHTDRR